MKNLKSIIAVGFLTAAFTTHAAAQAPLPAAAPTGPAQAISPSTSLGAGVTASAGPGTAVRPISQANENGYVSPTHERGTVNPRVTYYRYANPSARWYRSPQDGSGYAYQGNRQREAGGRGLGQFWPPAF